MLKCRIDVVGHFIAIYDISNVRNIVESVDINYRYIPGCNLIQKEKYYNCAKFYYRILSNIKKRYRNISNAISANFEKYIQKFNDEKIKLLNQQLGDSGILLTISSYPDVVHINLHKSYNLSEHLIVGMIPKINPYPNIYFVDTCVINFHISKSGCLIKNAMNQTLDLTHHISDRVHNIVHSKELIKLYQQLKHHLVADISKIIIRMCFDLCYYDWDFESNF